jgi:hypothetical protein
MASDIPLGISISPTLARLAKRFDIDLSVFAEEALTERVLRDPVAMLTARMRTALLASQRLAADSGHEHIGTEHIFLAILLDENALPSQIMQSIGGRDEVVRQVRTLLASDSYSRPASA